MMFCITGIKKASVFPVPVLAWAMLRLRLARTSYIPAYKLTRLALSGFHLWLGTGHVS